MTLYAYKTPEGEILQETVSSNEWDCLAFLLRMVRLEIIDSDDLSNYQRVEVKAVEV